MGLLQIEPLTSPSDLELLKEKIQRENGVPECCIRVCTGTACRASGGLETYQELEKELAETNVEVKPTGCQGFCEKGPIVTIEPQGIFYQKVRADNVPEVLDHTIKKGELVSALQVEDPNTGEVAVGKNDIPFYKKQQLLVLGNCGKVDPGEIRDYIKEDGYQALAKVLSSMTSERVIEEIKLSGLRGRGGGGFSAGLKWQYGRSAKGDEKFVIANGDEGDPGAFMDRSIMEGNPHSLLEGMTICAFAVGDCAQGYIYVREEYHLAVEYLDIAIKQAREYGLLGENILGSGFDFDIELRRGAGAFVCGESTALMYSIEGKRGMPRLTPPRSVEAGLWGKPTVLNNIETFANVPWIITHGVDRFKEFGTEGSSGTKVFALTGKIKNTGLVEVPLGITIREIVFDIGGGVPEGRNFKAVQIGGPSGGCLPESLIDLPVDFDSLNETGAMMGSGGLVVIDDSDCVVDIARYFLAFTQKESCGKCVPCRIGTKRMLEILTRITEGKARDDDLESLRILADDISVASLCGLGQSAPSPVITALRYFADEFEAHVHDKSCPAKVCKALLVYSIDEASCNGCGACRRICPTSAISGEKKQPHAIDQSKCIHCGECFSVCKFGAAIKE